MRVWHANFHRLPLLVTEFGEILGVGECRWERFPTSGFRYFWFHGFYLLNSEKASALLTLLYSFVLLLMVRGILQELSQGALWFCSSTVLMGLESMQSSCTLRILDLQILVNTILN